MNFFPGEGGFGGTLITVPRHSRQQSHAAVLETLFHNFDFDLEQVSDTIDPILTVSSRCQQSSLYVQGIVARQATFLSTNLVQGDAIHVTAKGQRWSIGRSCDCAITVPHPLLSSHQAVIHYVPFQGFFLVATEASSTTRLRGTTLQPHRWYSLDNGDLIELGRLRIEFFLDCFSQPAG